MSEVEYIHLAAGSELPNLLDRPRRVMLLSDQKFPKEWGESVCEWIVASGCRYFMAWGIDCENWENGIDTVFLSSFNWKPDDIPENEYIYTTGHRADPLHEVFFFARLCAFHPVIPLPLLSIIDVRAEARENAILALHEAEGAGLLEDAFEDARELPFKDRLKILMRKK